MAALLAKLDVIPGYKSHLVLLAALGLWVAGVQGYATKEQVDQGLTALGILFGGTLANKVNRVGAAVKDAFDFGSAEPTVPDNAPGTPGNAGNATNGLILILAMAGAALVLLSGCTSVRFDGAGARAIAEDQLAMPQLDGPIIEPECTPLADFAERMLDDKGGQRDLVWLWTKKNETEPKVIAASARTQFQGCSILATRSADGATAERMRAIVRDFWTRTGLKVGPAGAE